jgi:hypothetical protein
MSNSYRPNITNNFYGGVGQYIEHIDHQVVSFDKDMNMHISQVGEQVQQTEQPSKEFTPETIPSIKFCGLKSRFGKNEVIKWYKKILEYGKDDKEMLSAVSEEDWVTAFDEKKALSEKINWEGCLSTLVCVVFWLTGESVTRRLDQVFLYHGKEINRDSLKASITTYCTKKIKSDFFYGELIKQPIDNQ